MFNDLFHLIHSLERHFRDEEEDRIHSLLCRSGAISLRRIGFKAQIVRLPRDIDFVIGDPDEELPREGAWIADLGTRWTPSDPQATLRCAWRTFKGSAADLKFYNFRETG